MKFTLTRILSKPRVVVPVVAIMALIIGAISFTQVGKAPVISKALNASSTQGLISSNGTLSLSFNASGRVAAVFVKVGDKVIRGQTLAALDASTAQGALNQAKGALDLAKAQLGSLSVQYQNAKVEQDVLVNNAHHTLLSSSLQALPIGNTDETHNPTISGTYICDKEGSYEIDSYASGTNSGFSFNYKGLEEGTGEVTYGTPQPVGTCGLMITFARDFVMNAKWIVWIPNTTSSSYQSNKNAYDLAVSTRSQVLTQLSANLGANGARGADTANAAVSAAQGAYDATLAQYQNSNIIAPDNGVVSYIDASLKIGQSVVVGRPVISVTPN